MEVVEMSIIYKTVDNSFKVTIKKKIVKDYKLEAGMEIAFLPIEGKPDSLEMRIIR
jgi:hypothetical protein